MDARIDNYFQHKAQKSGFIIAKNADFNKICANKILGVINRITNNSFKETLGSLNPLLTQF